MATLNELSRNIEAMSMSSILTTDIATPPPPPPPLEIERWRTLSKSYGGSKKLGGFFSRQFSPEKESFNVEKTRGGEISGPQSRFSRESSVESNKSLSSIGSKLELESSEIMVLSGGWLRFYRKQF